MPKKTIEPNEEMIDLLQKVLIVELGKIGVPQNEIARILKIHVTKVSPILKYFNKKSK